MDEELRAELAVRELLLRALLLDLVKREPAACTSLRDAIEQMKGASPTSDAALMKWSKYLKL